MTEEERKIARLVGGVEDIDLPYQCGCGGSIVQETFYHPAIHDPHGAIGPGYRPLRRSYETHEYYCRSCGLMYRFPPGSR